MAIPSGVPVSRRAAAAGGLIAVLGVGSTGLVRAATKNDSGTQDGGCNRARTITVRTTEEMFQQVKAAAGLVETSTTECVVFDVKEQASGDVAADIERDQEAPDVWIPDSKVWVDNINELDGRVKLVAGTTIATSPVIMAIPKSLRSLKGLKGKPSWATLLGDKMPTTTSDPNKTTSSLMAIIAANQAVKSKSAKTDLLASYLRLSRSTTTEDVLLFAADKDAKDARLFPTSEQRLASYNRSHPQSELKALIPKEGAGELTHIWVTPKGSSAPQEPLDQLRRQLLSPEGRSQMVQAGLRVPDAIPPQGTGVPQKVRTIRYPTLDQSQGAQRAWISLRKDARMLVLVDVSGSMILPSEGDTRVGALIKMADGAMDGLPEETSIGAWVFSTNLDGPGKDYKVLTSGTKPLSAPGYKAELKKKLRTLPALVQRNGDTGLYDSVSAAYHYMTRTYDPKYVNSVVILTDGKNDDPGGGTDLKTLVKQLTDQYDRKKPVKVVSVAVGDGADPEALKKIAKPSNGLSYVASTPAEITSVFVDAFLRRGE